jgi:hypothetical protein
MQVNSYIKLQHYDMVEIAHHPRLKKIKCSTVQVVEDTIHLADDNQQIITSLVVLMFFKGAGRPLGRKRVPPGIRRVRRPSKNA